MVHKKVRKKIMEKGKILEKILGIMGKKRASDILHINEAVEYIYVNKMVKGLEFVYPDNETQLYKNLLHNWLIKKYDYDKEHMDIHGHISYNSKKSWFFQGMEEILINNLNLDGIINRTGNFWVDRIYFNKQMLYVEGTSNMVYGMDMHKEQITNSITFQFNFNNDNDNPSYWFYPDNPGGEAVFNRFCFKEMEISKIEGILLTINNILTNTINNYKVIGIRPCQTYCAIDTLKSDGHIIEESLTESFVHFLNGTYLTYPEKDLKCKKFIIEKITRRILYYKGDILNLSGLNLGYWKNKDPEIKDKVNGLLEDPSWSIYLFYNNNIYNSKHYKYGENTIHLDILSEKVIVRYPDTIFKLIEIK